LKGNQDSSLDVAINNGDDDDYRAQGQSGTMSLAKGDDGKRMLELDDSIYCLTFVCMIDDVRLHWGFTKDLEDYFFKASMIFSI
jgi:hypothetical protein